LEPAAELRCGDDLRPLLPAAGWAGEYLCLADPVCQGPVAEQGGFDAWLDLRAGFIATHAGIPAAGARARLAAEYAALRDHRGPLRLWFEHDLWDQVALIRALSLMPWREGMALMPADGRRCFPELSVAELAALRPVPLPPGAVALGAEAWAAFAAPDPRPLAALAGARDDLPLPHLAAALRRHLQDLPWATDGLALTERLALRAVAEGGGARDLSAVFRAVRREDPVFHVTDLILAEVLARLAAGPAPLLERDANGAFAPTPRGHAVLAGQAVHATPARWLGGIALGPGGAPWRWDPDRDGPV
jgi:hypothetical protein